MTQEKIETFVNEAKTAALSDEFGPGNERWEMRPLSELIEPVLGKTPKRSEEEYWSGDIQWASAKDISQSKTRHIYDTAENMTEAGKEASNAKVLPAGTVVVIARGATMGRVAQLGRPMTFNQTCYALDTNDKLLDDYLYYAWQYVFGQVKAVSYGTVFDTITMKSFDDIEIPLPPIEIQEKIAEVLSSFDDKIEQNLSLADDLESLAEAEFQRFMSEADESWEETEFNAIVEMHSGGPRKSTDQYTGGEYEWLTPTDVTDNGLPVINSTERKLNDLAFEETSADLLPENTVFLTSRATIGEVVMNKRPMAMNQGFIGLVPKERVSPHFLAHLVKRKRAVIESRASGSTYAEISQRSFGDIEIEIPPKPKIEEFEEYCTPVYSLISSLLNEISLLDETQKCILPKLLSGQASLPE